MAVNHGGSPSRMILTEAGKIKEMTQQHQKDKDIRYLNNELEKIMQAINDASGLGRFSVNIRILVLESKDFLVQAGYTLDISKSSPNVYNISWA